MCVFETLMILSVLQNSQNGVKHMCFICVVLCSQVWGDKMPGNRRGPGVVVVVGCTYSTSSKPCTIATQTIDTKRLSYIYTRIWLGANFTAVILRHEVAALFYTFHEWVLISVCQDILVWCCVKIYIIVFLWIYNDAIIGYSSK